MSYLEIAQSLIKGKNESYINILKYIYDFRAITSSQLVSMHRYEASLDDKKAESETRLFIKKALSLSLIKGEFVFKLNDTAYMLEPIGVKIVQAYHSIPKVLYSQNAERLIENSVTARTLSVNPRLLSHHCETIRFLTTFLDQKREVPFNHFSHNFYLESEMCKSNQFFMDVRPDAIISFFNSYIFVETDMSTESKKQLREKWQRYRNFLSSSNYKYSGEKIYVFMTVPNNEYASQRIEAIKVSISDEMLDVIDENFDVFIGTLEDLVPIVLEKIVKPYFEKDHSIIEIGKSFKSKGFKVDYAMHLRDFFPKTNYDLYIRKVDENMDIFQNDGGYMEFLVDDYSTFSMAAASKIMYTDRNNIRFNQYRDSKIKYIMIFDSLEEVYDNLFFLKILTKKGIYFTTKKRLSEMEYPLSIVSLDNTGNVFHYLDDSLQVNEFETLIEKGRPDKIL